LLSREGGVLRSTSGFWEDLVARVLGEGGKRPGIGGLAAVAAGEGCCPSVVYYQGGWLLLVGAAFEV